MDTSAEYLLPTDTPLERIQRTLQHHLREVEIAFIQKMAWKEPGFDLQKKLDGTTGLIVELGGPSDNPYGWDITDRYRVLGIDSRQLRNAGKLVVTDKTDHPFEDTLTNNFLPALQPIDLKIDAAHLPFPDTSLNAVLMTRLSPAFVNYQQIISEAGRCIKPGGLLIWQAISPEDIAQIEKAGFVQKMRTPGPFISQGPEYSVAFEKIALPPVQL